MTQYILTIFRSSLIDFVILCFLIVLCIVIILFLSYVYTNITICIVCDCTKKEKRTQVPKVLFWKRNTLKYRTLLYQKHKASTSGHISRQNCNSKNYIHLYVHSSSIHNSQDIEATQGSIHGWIDGKMQYVPAMQYYSASKRKKSWHMLQNRWAFRTLC